MIHYLITTLAVLATLALTGWIFYLLVKRYFDNEHKERLLQMKIDERRETLKTVTPIRLQAYERMALFLERIAPGSLVLRCYNLSQQVYVSSELWTSIREAKDEMINLVNSAAVSLTEETDPTRLAASIFASAAQHSPCDTALEALHKEVNELFG